MKNKIDNLLEELSCEPRSPDYDSVLSSMLQIDSKAREVAKGYGVSVEQVYKAIDFYPEGFVSEFGSDAEGSDFACSDVMRDLQVLEKQLVHESHKQYGGIRMPEFMRNERAEVSLPLPSKKETAPIGGVKRGEIVLKEEMGIFDYVANFIRKHPKLSASGGIALLFGLGYATNDTVKDKTDKTVENIYEKYFSKFSGKAVVVPVIVANATVTATPQVTGTPYHFTPDLKVFGSDEYKRRVQKSLDELNKTPDSFRINGMTAYEYATYYMDELYEGNEEKIIEDGKEQYPIKYISASNLIHIPRHIEQGFNQTFKDELNKWISGIEDKDTRTKELSLFLEHDAIELQVSWEKARYNLTDEQAKNRFISYMKQYTNDSKYFEEELIKN